MLIRGKNISGDDATTNGKWVQWEEIIEWFTVIYLNWNPQIYPYRKTVNSRWEKGDRGSKFWDERYSVEFCP